MTTDCLSPKRGEYAVEEVAVSVNVEQESIRIVTCQAAIPLRTRAFEWRKLSCETEAYNGHISEEGVIFDGPALLGPADRNGQSNNLK